MQQKKTDWNNLFFILSISLIFYLYITYSNIEEIPSPEYLQKEKTEQAENNNGQLVNNADSLNIVANTNQTEPITTQNSAISADEINNYIIENEVFELKFSNKGALLNSVTLKDYKKYDSSQIVFMQSEAENWDFEFKLNDKYFNNKNLLYKSDAKESIVLKEQDKHQISFDVDLEQHKISHVYTIHGNSYYIDYDLYIDGRLTNDINFVWNSRLEQLEKSFSTEQNMATTYYKLKEDDEVDYLSEMSDDDESDFEDRLLWVSHKQQFFTRTIMHKEGFKNPSLSNKQGQNDETYLKDLNTKANIVVDPTSSKHQFPFKLYFGPLKHETLSESGNDHENIIPLGWPIFRAVTIFFISPVFSWLEGFNVNYGIIILLLAIMIKLIVSPLTYKTYTSQIKMKMLKPELNALKEQHKGDNQKFSQAQMALYSQMGVSPLSGCIPMLLQMPILFAMFRFFPSSIQLRQQGFLWADDLSSYDSIMSLPFEIPFYGAHVSLFTILMTITSVFYTRMNSNMMDTGADNPMASQMKMMQYFMPIMFLGIFNNFSSALSYYYLLFNLLSFGQQFVLKKIFIDEEKIKAEMEERKKRPVKKGKFQKRLDDYMKEQAKKK